MLKSVYDDEKGIFLAFRPILWYNIGRKWRVNSVKLKVESLKLSGFVLGYVGIKWGENHGRGIKKSSLFSNMGKKTP